MKSVGGFLLLLLACGATYWGLTIPPAGGFARPELARMIVFHLPCAFVATVFLLWGTYLSLRAMQAKNLTADVSAVAAMEITLLMCILTMATGVLFSKAQWGAWWQWDPRQTSFLLVLLIVAAYFALRLAFADEQKRAQHSAAYVVGSAIPNLFLIFVFPRVPSLGSFHPSDSIVKGKFDSNYWSAILGVFVVLMLVSIWLYRLRTRAGTLELALENRDGQADVGTAAPTGVVRRVAVSDSGHPED